MLKRAKRVFTRGQSTHPHPREPHALSTSTCKRLERVASEAAHAAEQMRLAFVGPLARSRANTVRSAMQQEAAINELFACLLTHRSALARALQHARKHAAQPLQDITAAERAICKFLHSAHLTPDPAWGGDIGQLFVELVVGRPRGLPVGCAFWVHPWCRTELWKERCQLRLNDSKQRLLSSLDHLDEGLKREVRVVRLVGNGAYCIVWEARRKESGERVAVKKYFEALAFNKDAQCLFRVLWFTQQLSQHPNFLRLHSARCSDNQRDLFVVCEYMENDLRVALRDNALLPVHKQFVVYQLLSALHHMHSGGLVHCDLQRAHILLNSDCTIRIGGLASARHVDGDEAVGVDEYYTQRFNLPPEQLTGSRTPNPARDMWSVGCLIGEIIKGRPMFPGSSSLQMLQRFEQLLGAPTPDDIESLASPFATVMFEAYPRVPRAENAWEEMFPNAPPDGVDLVRRLVVVNPNERLSAREALQHPFVAAFHSAAHERPCRRPLNPRLHDRPLSTQQIADKVRREIKIVRRR